MEFELVEKSMAMVYGAVEVGKDLPFDMFLASVAMILEERIKDEEDVTMVEACEKLLEAAKGVHEKYGEY